ncbi:ANTAR domain-containing protein [Streptomyces collinus]|uniref:ANTAR domain-containing protein n=1 Tax=Streptomyces collinus TaxID=42684 RepID=UPI0036AEE4B8
MQLPPPSGSASPRRMTTTGTCGKAEATADPEGRERHTSAELLREKEQLKYALESRPVIDMARGVLVAGYACRPEEASEILVTASQRANAKVRDVAEAVTAAAMGRPMSAELQGHLAVAVRTWQAKHEGRPHE